MGNVQVTATAAGGGEVEEIKNSSHEQTVMAVGTAIICPMAELKRNQCALCVVCPQHTTGNSPDNPCGASLLVHHAQGA